MSSPSALFPPGTPGVVARVGEHARKPGRYRVSLADGRRFLVDADGVSAVAAIQPGALREGASLETAAIGVLEASHRDVACFDRAIGMLARARRTERELAQRLRRLEPDPDVVSRALERLARLGLLDDAAVARAEAASRFRRGEGAGRIRQSLARKGVERSVVDDAIREVAAEDDIDDRSLCQEAAEKRLRSLGSHEPAVQYRRLTGFLLRRGFSGYVVRDVVDALLPRGRRLHE